MRSFFSAARSRPYLLLVFAVPFVASSCGLLGSLLIADPLRSIDVDGRTRTYRIHVPDSYTGDSAVPLVFVLHGGTSNADETIRYTRFDAQADTSGFIAVYPNGTRKQWNDGRNAPTTPVGQVDDVNFIRTLIDQLSEQYNIDPKRVYACGISNGAMMSYRLACELSDRIAAIGPVAGNLPVNIADSCQPAAAVSVIAFHGTDDEFVPIDGGQIVGNRGAVRSLSETLAKFAGVAGCTTQPVSEDLPDVDPNDGTTVRLDRYTPCSGPQAVEAYVIDGGGHTWPGARPVRTFRLGRTTQDVNATQLIWEFFAAHPKP